MRSRLGVVVLFVLAAALPAFAQTAPAPQRPFSAGALGGLAAGHEDAGAAFGGNFVFDVSHRIAVEARGLHQDRGSGERGTELTGTVLVTLARSPRVAPYAAVGGGVYRATFDLGDSRFFGMMDDEFAAGTRFMPLQSMAGFAMMGTNTAYTGSMWQGTWTGPTFTASQMPMFYAARLGEMMVQGDGHWGTRHFTDPALTLGGGVKIGLTSHLYVSPDVRGVIVFSRGNQLAMMTMNVGVGVRF